MKRTIRNLVLATVISAPSAFAQMGDIADLNRLRGDDKTSIRPVTNLFSLIDLSKVRWNHSYGVTYSSSARGSGSYGMYTSSFIYSLAPSLTLGVGVGLGHDPAALFNRTSGADARVFPAVGLDYHPSDNFRLYLGYAQSPGWNPGGGMGFSDRLFWDMNAAQSRSMPASGSGVPTEK